MPSDLGCALFQQRPLEDAASGLFAEDELARAVRHGLFLDEVVVVAEVPGAETAYCDAVRARAQRLRPASNRPVSTFGESNPASRSRPRREDSVAAPWCSSRFSRLVRRTRASPWRRKSPWREGTVATSVDPGFRTRRASRSATRARSWGRCSRTASIVTASNEWSERGHGPSHNRSMVSHSMSPGHGDD